MPSLLRAAALAVAALMVLVPFAAAEGAGRDLLLQVRGAPLEEARDARARAARTVDAATLRFLDALLLAREGDLAGAERELRRLLAEDSSRRLVRFELVRVLMDRERYTAARFQLNRLSVSETNPAVRAEYDRLDREITRRRPWDFALELSAAPRTNANRGSDETAILVGGTPFVIDEEARARGGIGFRYGAIASYRMPLTDETMLTGRTFVRGATYDENTLTTTHAGAGLSVRHSIAPGAFAEAGTDVARDFSGGDLFAGDLYATTITPFAALSAPIGRRLRAGASGRFSWVDYDSDALTDGWRGTVQASLGFAPAPGRSASVFAAYGFDASGREHLRFDSATLGASFYAELPWSVTATTTASAGLRHYRADFPGQLFARQDRFWRVGVELTKRDWAIAGFAPKIGASFERQTSNVAFYTFDDAGVSIGLSRSF